MANGFLGGARRPAAMSAVTAAPRATGAARSLRQKIEAWPDGFLCTNISCLA